MSVQIKRHTRSSRGTRRAHHALKRKKLTQCKECGSPKQPHHLCLNCQKY